MTIFLERLQAVVTADISDGIRKLKEISERGKATIRDLSGTAVIRIEAKMDSIRESRAKMQAEADANPIEEKVKANADLASVAKAFEEMKAAADLKDIKINTKVNTSGLSTAGGFLAGITGLKMDAALAPDLNKIIGMGTLLASAVAFAGTAVIGLGGALVATLPSALAMGSALGALVPLAGAGFLAFSGFTGAMQKYSQALASGKSPAQAFTAATVGMDTAQKNFMHTLIGLEVPFKKLKESIQAIVLPAATNFLNSMAKTILPVLIPGFTGAAGALAGFIKNLQGMLTAKDTVNMMKEMNGANTEMIKNILGAGIPAIHGFMEALFGTRGVAIQMTQSLKDSMGRFDAWITAAQKSGELAKVVSNAWQILRNLLDGVGNFAVAVGHVLAIGAPGLLVFAKAFNELFTHMKDAVGPGSAAISSFFQDVGKVGQQLSGALQSLGPGLAKLIEALGKLAATTVGPALELIAPVISNLAGGLAGLAPVITALITPLGNIIAVLGTGLVNALKAITPMLTTFASQIGQNLTQAAFTLFPLLPPLAKAFVGILNALSPILPVIATLVTTLAPALVTGVTAITTSITDLMPGVTTLVIGLGKGLSQVVTTLAPQIPVLATALDQVLLSITPLLPVLANLVASFGTALLNAIVGLANALVPLINDLVPVITFFSKLADSILKMPVLGPMIAAFAALAFIFGKMVIGLAPAIPMLNDLRKALTDVGPAAGEAVKGMTGMSLVATGGLALGLTAVVGALVLLGATLYKVAFAHWSMNAAVKASADALSQNYVQALQQTNLTAGQQIDALKDKISGLKQSNVEIVDSIPADKFNAKLSTLAGGQDAYLNKSKDSLAQYFSKTGQLNQEQINQYQKQIDDLNRTLASEQKAQQDSYRAAGIAAGYTGDLAIQYGELKAKGDALNTTLNTITGSLDNYIGSGLSADQATSNWDNAIENLDQTLHSAQGKISQTTAITNMHTGAQLAVHNAMQSTAQAMQTIIKQMIDSHQPYDTVIGKAQSLTTQLEKEGVKYGLTKGQVDDYLHSLHLTPAEVSTELKLKNYQSVLNQINTIHSSISGIPDSKVSTLTVNGVVFGNYKDFTMGLQQAEKQRALQRQGMASGGVLGGFKTNTMALVGEDRSGYDEYVIPTNPAHRKNALKLLGNLVAELGMAGGGIVNKAITINAQSNLAGVPGAIFDGLNREVATFTNMVASVSRGVHDRELAAAASAGGGGAAQWAPVATQVANMMGQPLAVAALLRRINFESGGNPTAVNRTDSNWQAGHPSVGLMQVIAGTFAANAGGFASTGPFMYGVSVDPMANIFAGAHYATGRYGSIAAVDPLVMHSGYDQGGILYPGITMAVNNTGKNEYVSRTPPLTINVDARGSTNPGATRQEVVSGITQMLPVLTQHLNR